MNEHPPAAKDGAGEKTFSAQDQHHFAAATGDWNPMHVDAVAARRLLTGRQVVHGIHTLLYALDRAGADLAPGPLSIATTFAHPVSVGDPVRFTRTDPGDGRILLAASVDGLVCTEVNVRPASDVPAATAAAERPIRRLTALEHPLDEEPGSQTGYRIEMTLPPVDLAPRFPRAAALLSDRGLAALGLLSTFVGMVCPGLHSVFSSLRFDTRVGPGESLLFDVCRYDPRFRLYTVSFEGVLRGELRAFLRPPPQPQPSAQQVGEHLDPQCFRGTRSLVIGGSRGLGEITAKIIAAGGGDVTITYAVGQADAEVVARDINAQARGRCTTAALDLGAPFVSLPGVAPADLDAIYYFATPRIYTKRSEVFDRDAFDAFVTVYLQRFHELCNWAEQAARPWRLKVYLPSTVFIAERPKGMTEYTMVKAAAEVLADDLNRQLRHVEIVHTRLPRLATDQTASLLKVDTGSNLEAMLEVVRRVTGAG